MRKNLPVTTREVELDDHHAIVSKTDLDGNIVYVNPYFIQISGFADKRLQDTKDPLAPANRRIEILLQTDHG